MRGLVCGEPHVRNAELVGILDLLAELGRGRSHVSGDATGAQLVGDQVGRGTVLLVPHGHEHGSRRHTIRVGTGGVQHVRNQAGQADGQAHTRVLLAALRCEVVVTTSGADGSERGCTVKERLIHGTGVVIQAAGDLQIRNHGARANTSGLVNNHRQRVKTLTCERIRLGIIGDVVLLAQRVELAGQLRTISGGELRELKARTSLILVGSATFHQQLGHFVGTDFVELVDLTKHAFDVVQAQTTVETFGELAVVRMHGGLRQTELAQTFQSRYHDQRQLNLIMIR